jgi:hypothetical protein
VAWSESGLKNGTKEIALLAKVWRHAEQKALIQVHKVSI